MSVRIEDYGLIGDLQTAALVSRHGSIDWLCLPRFDSAACLASLVGTAENGHWSLHPVGSFDSSGWRYMQDTLVLETTFETSTGAARLIDFMPPRATRPHVVRIIEGIRGTVDMELELALRFEYGSAVPWVRSIEGISVGICGPDAVAVHAPIDLEDGDLRTHAVFAVRQRDRVPFVLTWFPSHEQFPKAVDPEAALLDTIGYWNDWARDCASLDRWGDEVRRSLITLKALTYAPTGGMVAAPTTSLPVKLGGVRNWDYRFCWVRDATLTLLAFLRAGYLDEARAWRDWLLRAVAGAPEAAQIMYGVAGERRLTEAELPWLSGYEGSRPVRIGNAASEQRQLDVYGEVVDALYISRLRGLEPSEAAWALGRKILEWLESGWREPDEGMWEVRGPRRHFTHSKVMAWVAFDRGVKLMQRFPREGPLDRWRATRKEIRAEVLRHAYDSKRGTFVQSYGSDRLDANLLMIPLVGFLPATDERVVGTVDAIRRDLLRDGLVERYRADEENLDVDGLPPGEGVFLMCSFWLAAVLAMQGRLDESVELFERLLSLRNDLGLISEEYDPERKRLLGNFPQAFTHLSLVETAFMLSRRVSKEARTPTTAEAVPPPRGL
jgi:GH15 family glucan-1,4-alpha-glucosidase